MALTEIHGDLFQSTEWTALSHSNNQDCQKGAGIAWELVPVVNKSRLIFHLITMHRVWDKLTYQTLSAALHSLKCQCIKLQVHQFTMQTIGCGFDELIWIEVSKMIQRIFNEIHILMLVYH